MVTTTAALNMVISELVNWEFFEWIRSYAQCQGVSIRIPTLWLDGARPPREPRYLTGENLEVVWAEFSAISLAVLFHSNKTSWHTHSIL